VRLKSTGLVTFSTMNLEDKIEEINRRLIEIERTRKEGKEARRFEEIRLREEEKKK
jgi:hypothetical protein